MRIEKSITILGHTFNLVWVEPAEFGWVAVDMFNVSKTVGPPEEFEKIVKENYKRYTSKGNDQCYTGRQFGGGRYIITKSPDENEFGLVTP